MLIEDSNNKTKLKIKNKKKNKFSKNKINK